MLGIRGLFIPGPTNVPQAVRLAMDVSMLASKAMRMTRVNALESLYERAFADDGSGMSIFASGA